MKCVSHCGPGNGDTPLIFQPDLNLDLECDLVIGKGIMLVERGKNS